MDKQIHIAVAGLGNIGNRHLDMVKAHPEACLAGVIDTEPTQKKVLESYEKVPFYARLEEFINADQGNSDLIHICTPNGSHAPLALQALENGYHVVIEKPMAIHAAQAQWILDTAKAHSKEVFVVKQNRFNPPAKFLKETIENGNLGQVYMVQVNCFWNRDERYYKSGSWRGTLEEDGGALLTQFSHFIDILYWVFGDVANVHATFSNFNHQEQIEFEDSGMVTFDLVSGGKGSINYSISCWEQNMESSIAVIGEKGCLKIGGQYMNEISYFNVKNMGKPDLAATNPPNSYDGFMGSAGNHYQFLQDVIDHLKGRKSNGTNAYEAAKVVEIIDKTYQHRDLKQLKAKANVNR